MTDSPLSSEQDTMQAAGFEWDPTDAGYPRWIHRSKDIYCVRPPHVNDQEWEERKNKHIAQSKIDMPPSFFAKLGSPCCSRWANAQAEWIALAYVQALANDGDTWKRLSRERAYELLTDEQKRCAYTVLNSGFYSHCFESVADRITGSDGAFSVGGFWHRGRV